MMPASRREILRASALGAGALLGLPLLSRGAGFLGAAHADPQGLAGRKFLFVFAAGGWDPTWVFAPMYGSPAVATDPSGAPWSVGGLSLVDSAARPSVRSFFERYAARTCLWNGLEVRSVTHERCRRMLFTGSSAADSDDWPARLAGSVTGYQLPHLVISGPAFSSQHTSAVVRLGETGQLGGLLDGTALSDRDTALQTPSAATDGDVASFLASRRAAFLASAADPWQEGISQDLLASADRLALVRALPGLDLSVALSGITPVRERVQPALACFEAGYARCAMIAHKGQFDVGWDTHSGISAQSTHFEVLFQDLLAIMDELERRRGTSGQPLSEEVVLVVLSEMGRAPAINPTGGKDHWTFTSAMLIGPGVRGGLTVGGFDDSFLGRPIDLASGQPSDSGTLASSANFGATLLALADIDPGPDQPVTAILA